MEQEECLEVSSRPSSCLNYALPFELLGEIFSHISEDPLDLRYAILVCRSWHNAVVHHPNLWTSIILGSTFLTRFRGARLHHGDAFVRLCISRSSPLPLRISVYNLGRLSLYDIESGAFSDECFSDECFFDECFSLVKHILDRYSGEPDSLFQRCSSLSWIFVGEVPGIDLVARTFTEASFPALEYMTIQNLSLSDVGPTIGFPRLPRLREVTLIDHSESCIPPFFHDNDFANVERLTFVTTSAWMDFDVNCIRRFRSIRVLMLKGESFHDNYLETLHDPLKPVELSLLETLSLSGEVPHQILNLIRTPGLRTMEIEADSAKGYHSLAAPNLVHMVWTLERLCVSLSEEMHETSWVEELEQLVARAPSLSSVLVSPWMVRHLAGKEWHIKLHVTDPK